MALPTQQHQAHVQKGGTWETRRTIFRVWLLSVSQPVGAAVLSEFLSDLQCRVS